MIKDLRKKVFWSILLTAAGLLLAILLAINVLNLVQTASKKKSILESALTLLQQESGTGKGHDSARGIGKGRSELLRSVSEDELGVLLLETDGSSVSGTGCTARLDEETLKAIAAAAFADTSGRGSINGWEYKTAPCEDGLLVSFLDAHSLRKENAETALLSLAAFALAFGLFALMARFLSRVIVRPVEENVEAQKRFIADASHELKTPLTVIDANVSVLEQSIGENKWLGYIREQSGRMAGLVGELLQLSSLEEDSSGKTPQMREPFDAAEAVMRAALPFESVAFERGLTLETDIPDSVEALGSAGELEQLTAILIDNAVKHSAEGGTVKVSLNPLTDRHGRKEETKLELRVQNTGETIPPEALPHIFDRFYRADGSRTHKDNSFGLGLAIARSLAEKNNGILTAASQNGVTEFIFLMPLR